MSTPWALLFKIYVPREKKKIAMRIKKGMIGGICKDFSNENGKFVIVCTKVRLAVGGKK